MPARVRPAGGPCRDAAGIAGAAGVAVSSDSGDLYVAASSSEAVAGFRAGPDGALSQTGCITRATDEDGLSESPVEAGCTAGTEIWEPVAVAASADGRTVYAAGADTVTSYRRDPASGALRQTGCADEETSGLCQAARAIDGVRAIAVTSDGTNVYTASDSENAVAVFGATVLGGPARADPPTRRGARRPPVPARRGPGVRWDRRDRRRRARRGPRPRADVPPAARGAGYRRRRGARVAAQRAAPAARRACDGACDRRPGRARATDPSRHDPPRLSGAAWRRCATLSARDRPRRPRSPSSAAAWPRSPTSSGWPCCSPGTRRS